MYSILLRLTAFFHVHIHSSRPSRIRVMGLFPREKCLPSFSFLFPWVIPKLTLLSLSLIGQLVFQLLAQRLHQEAAEADGA
jgi:hypothetical protein